MKRSIGVLMTVVVFVSMVLTGGVDAQEPNQPPGYEGSVPQIPLPPTDDDGGSALAFTFTEDVVIADPASQASSLTLREPGTSNDWVLSGGFNGDFGIYDTNELFRTLHEDGLAGNSFFWANNDAVIQANGGSGSGGDVFVTASGTGGEIVLIADQDRTVVVSDGNVTPVTEVFRLASNVPPQQVFENWTSGAEWFFAITADDQFKVSRNGTGKVEAKFFENGNLQIAGTLIQTSDENEKNNLELADGAAVLDALADLDIATWEYNAQPGVTHLGPTAQDFATAFGLGDTPTGIAAVDADGVALAAIQALAQDNDDLRGEVTELRMLVEQLLAAS